MKRLNTIITVLFLATLGYAVKVETTTNLNIYYPEYTKIDLVCGQMPKTSQKDVDFCCEAAFTGELLTQFKHMNIADNHICNGVRSAQEEPCVMSRSQKEAIFEECMKDIDELA